ncbi:MAG TPA: phosphatase PAP2 family protein [Trebonia sp.]|nr:phosphatase PAP2 family protein [Trebonia sp.]
MALWDPARHALWLGPVVIALTVACVVAAPILVALTWPKPSGLRCVLAVVLGLGVVVLARHAAETAVFVQRPFVADHFRPLFPHSPDSSFPSETTGYFAAAAIPVLACWRRLGWALVAIAIEVAFGCVFVGVHYVTDVLAGLLIGAVGGGLAWIVLGAPGISRLLAATDTGLRAVRLRPRFVGPGRLAAF